MITSPASQESMDSQSGALANIIELARLSRLTLLYHGAAASAADGGSEQAAALAAAAVATQGEVVVLFDAGGDLPVPDLLADLEAAVLEAAPQAPLAPPMAGPVEALAFWQQALGMRFLLIMKRFDIALSRQDAEFDEVLQKLANDPLDVSVLLLMDEAAAPLLQRLKDALPELGETYLRLPEPAAAAPPPSQEPAPPDQPAPRPTPATPAARFGPSPFLFDDPDDDLGAETMRAADVQEEMTVPAPREAEAGQQKAPEQVEDRRRSRRFSTLLEQAGISDGFDAPAETVPAAAAPDSADPTLAIYPAAVPPPSAAPELALPDGRAEPLFEAPPARIAEPAAPAAGARAYRERRPMQVAAWMQKRRGRRRRDIVGIASRVGSSSTVVFVLMTMLALLGWQMPQLAAPAGAARPRAAAPQPAAQSSHAAALRGNRYRGSISAAAPGAGAGREIR
jgi:hypothetical protein